MADLLAYARPLPMERQALAVQALVAEALEACGEGARQKGVRLQSALRDPGRQLWVDGPRILQVLRNLLENAIQHAPSGTLVVLRAGPDKTSAGHWYLAVEDQGPGIPPEDLLRVFDPFFTRRKDGTGLGLAICQRIVAQHGGSLWAENRSEEGVRVAFRIPAERSDGAPPA
jgi:signal transduction histidine kinase